MVLLATVVTTTTAVDDMVDALVRALRPLRPVGVNPEAVALAFSLMLRAIPAIAEIADEARRRRWPGVSSAVPGRGSRPWSSASSPARG
jgi:hypothetical protein